jgi:hypothetical protein
MQFLPHSNTLLFHYKRNSGDTLQLNNAVYCEKNKVSVTKLVSGTQIMMLNINVTLHYITFRKVAMHLGYVT